MKCQAGVCARGRPPPEAVPPAFQAGSPPSSTKRRRRRRCAASTRRAAQKQAVAVVDDDPHSVAEAGLRMALEKATGSGSMCGRAILSLIASMSKCAAPGMCSARYSALASRPASAGASSHRSGKGRAPKMVGQPSGRDEMRFLRRHAFLSCDRGAIIAVFRLAPQKRAGRTPVRGAHYFVRGIFPCFTEAEATMNTNADQHRPDNAAHEPGDVLTATAWMVIH